MKRNLTMAALIAQSVGIPLFGWISDRQGHKWLGKFGATVGCLAALCVIVAPNPIWMYAVFMLANISRECLHVSRQSITMEFCGSDKLPTYTALSNTLLAIPLLLAPVLGGTIINMLSYRWAFFIGAIFYAAGWLVLHRSVTDPRKGRKTIE